jgi:hypothetical protein
MPNNYAGDGTTYPANIVIPTDGEPCSEAYVAPPFRQLADRTANLRRRIPTPYSYSYDDGVNTFWTYGNSFAIETTITAGCKVDVEGLLVGDKIQVDFFGNWRRADSGGGAADNPTVGFDAWLDAIDDYDGETPGTQTHIPGAHWNANGGIDTDLSTIINPFTLSGVWTVAQEGTTRITFAFDTKASWGTDTFELVGALNLVAIAYPV